MICLRFSIKFGMAFRFRISGFSGDVPK